MWMPPPDPDKPNCPYFPGFQVDISTHIAPLPLGGDYPTASYPLRTEEWLHSVSQTQHVVTHQPLETPAPAKSSTARLIVTRSLAIGNARGPQIVLCSVTPYGEDENATTFEAVAKIYDPLYYSFVSDTGSYPCDVVLRADEHYTQEVAAYECLTRAGQTGSFAPAYFGSWTFNHPICYNGEDYQRSIRLVLIEYLSGICMNDLFAKNGPYRIDATHLSKDYRLQVLAMLLDGVVKQHHVGISQRDLAPRNVFVIPPPKLARHSTLELTQELPQRVVLIDYNASTVLELTKYGKRAVQLARLPPNPMKRFWKTSLSDFTGWAPTELSDARRFQEWLCHKFGREKKALYEPILEELEFHKPTQKNPIGSSATKANIIMRTASLSGAAASQPWSTSSGTPAPSRRQPPAGSAQAPISSDHAFSRASGQTPSQQIEWRASSAQARWAPSGQRPPSRQEQGNGQNTTAPPGDNVLHSPSKSLQKSQEEFQVVKAPTMLKGEKPAPTSGPLFTLVRARARALEMGECREKY